MRLVVRTGLLLGGAAVLWLVALQSPVAADVVGPQPAQERSSPVMLSTPGSRTVDSAIPARFEAEPVAAEQEAAVTATEVAEAEAVAEEVVATPAPEQQVVRRAPVHLTGHSPAPVPQESAVERATRSLRMGLQHIGVSLGRVVSACEVGLGAGAGGPVLVLGLLSLATPFIRRWVLATRGATDEDMPEFLYAWELTPPG